MKRCRFTRRAKPAPDGDALDAIDVAKPCSVPWEDMRQVVRGEDRVRYCGQCSQNVYDVASMTRAEASALISKHRGRVCVQFYRRPDGRVVTRDCSTPEKRIDYQMPELRGRVEIPRSPAPRESLEEQARREAEEDRS